MGSTDKPGNWSVAHLKETPEWRALEKAADDLGYQLVVLPKEVIEKVEDFIGSHPELSDSMVDERISCVLEGFIETVRVLNTMTSSKNAPPSDPLAG